jgi:hypothetical protein
MNTKKTSKSLFDFTNAIHADQSAEFFDNLTEAELKSYRNSRYMINRVISMNHDYAGIVNAIQKYTSIPERMHYLFYTNILPKKKQFNKYIKSAAEDKYEDWMVSLVAKHYAVSRSEAVEYIEIFYLQNKDELRELCEKYGIDQKLIKKVKL